MGCDETHCVPYIFTFGEEKSTTFKRTKILHYFTLGERKKIPHLSELTLLLPLLSEYF